jgi:tetratricopeptide (TPR) repeat protein
MKLCLSAAIAALLLAGCSNNAYQTAAIDHYVAGQMAAERQDYQAALAELAKALQQDPKFALAHAAVGDIYRKQGNLEQAVGAYEKSCDLNPYSFKPHYNLGVTYQMLSSAAKTAQAAADYLQKAVNTYLRATTLNDGDFDAKLNLAACYYQQGKYDLALQICEAAIKLSPDSPFGYSNLGIIYDAQNQPYKAIQAYKASLERDTHQPKLILNMGSTYMRLKRYNEAMLEFRLAAQEEPTSAAPHEQMGTCLFYQQKYDEALGAFDKSLELDPKSSAAHRGIGVIYMTQFLMDNTRTDLREKALGEWTRSLELEPNQPDLVRLIEKYSPRIPPPPPL